VRSTSCTPSRTWEYAYVGSGKRGAGRGGAGGGVLRLAGSKCGFSPIFAPVSRALPSPPSPPSETLPSRHSPPRYPCFALADLIRDSALNLVRYTAVCMLRPALPATSATRERPHAHTRACTRPLLSSSTPSRAYYRIFCPRALAHSNAEPYPGSPLVSCFHPARPRFSRERRPLHAAYPLFPHSSGPLLPSFTLLIPRLPFLSFSSVLSMSLLSLYPSSASLSLPSPPLGRPLYPLVTGSNPETNHPRLKPPSHSLRCPEREHLPTLLMFLLSVSTAPPAATDANGVVTTTDVALSPSSG